MKKKIATTVDKASEQFRAVRYATLKKHAKNCPPAGHWSLLTSEKIGISIVPALGQGITNGRIMAKAVLRFAELPREHQESFRKEMEAILFEMAVSLDATFFRDFANALHEPISRKNKSGIETASELDIYKFLTKHWKEVDKMADRKSLYNWLNAHPVFAHVQIDRSKLRKLLNEIAWEKTKLKA